MEGKSYKQNVMSATLTNKSLPLRDTGITPTALQVAVILMYSFL